MLHNVEEMYPSIEFEPDPQIYGESLALNKKYVSENLRVLEDQLRQEGALPPKGELPREIIPGTLHEALDAYTQDIRRHNVAPGNQRNDKLRATAAGAGLAFQGAPRRHRPTLAELRCVQGDGRSLAQPSSSTGWLADRPRQLQAPRRRVDPLLPVARLLLGVPLADAPRSGTGREEDPEDGWRAAAVGDNEGHLRGRGVGRTQPVELTYRLRISDGDEPADA